MPKLPYAHDKAFAPITLIGSGPNVLVVRADSPYKTVKDIIAAAKAKPGKLTYASQGNGTSAHLAGEMFTNLAKVEMTHVPYRGAGPAITDLLGGQVDMIFGTAAAVVDLRRQRQAARDRRSPPPQPSPRFKGVPTIAETVPGYAVESWYGLYAPAGTPPDVIAKLNAAAKKAAQSRRLREEGRAAKAWSSRAGDAGRTRPLRQGRGSALAQDRQGKQHQAATEPAGTDIRRLP